LNQNEKDVPKRCKETADHNYYLTTEDQDKAVKQQVDGDNQYQEASYIVSCLT